MKILNTKTRREIYKFLEGLKSPSLVNDILEHLHSKALRTNKTTIYRNLDLFEEEGLISKIEFGEGKARYELKRDDHHHLICTKCSRIQDFEDSHMEDLIKEVQKGKNFKVENHSFELFGVCSRHN
jgi:Fe2+ or Zn2+ uptake regulation protein